MIFKATEVTAAYTMRARSTLEPAKRVFLVFDNLTFLDNVKKIQEDKGQ